MNRKIKKVVLGLLAGNDLELARQELSLYDEHGLVNPLFSALYRPEEMLRWHTVTLFGEVVNRLAEKDMEAARIVMRRFLWSLNDESGGIGWGAPEAMAEAMVHHDGLCDEYLHMLISYMRPDGPLEHQDGNYLELPELQRGLLWGIARLAGARPELMREKGLSVDLRGYIRSEDATVRALAALALGRIGDVGSRDVISKMLEDRRPVRLYTGETVTVTTVADIAGAARQQLQTQLAV